MLHSFFISQVGAQKSKPTVEIENLRYQWLVKPHTADNLEPYIKEIHTNTNALHLILNLNEYKAYHLALNVPQKTSLLIQNQIVAYYSQSSYVQLSIDSLQDIYQQDSLYVSVFSEQNLVKNLHTQIIDLEPLKSLEANESIMSIEHRIKNTYQDFNIISILIIIILGVLVRSFRSVIFHEYFSLTKIFNLKPKSEVLYSISFLSTTNLLYLFLYGIITGLTLTNFSTWFFAENMMRLGYESFLSVLLLSMLVSALVIVLMLIKYVLIRIVSRIFSFRKVSNVHFYEYLRFSFIISVVLFIMFIVSQISGVEISITHISSLYILFIIRVLFIYIKLNNLQSFSKLHLFAYLCGTEFIPLIILLNIFNNYIEVF